MSAREQAAKLIELGFYVQHGGVCNKKEEPCCIVNAEYRHARYLVTALRAEDAAEREAVADERAAVVAWLKVRCLEHDLAAADASDRDERKSEVSKAFAYQAAALAIESGRHRGTT